ncbi:sugar ABC transporter substrate-binding protein [Bifidobacterium lemurum]|uniref:Sugar ABC transporter substrate-binding protein n=1 Tax=Bifidobacterium lemurum TaxID=1603886 RepID=A0A261FPB6_9BIFI|nr:extracellular solute-binding protein [Bifidobacterium lemurum]OZG60938.1 sugar ABC transporter substrate-binding protein [Bifidobacterium lemurum]QOL34987.1 extracellular solute-binding protein [Bifidobacterium lemurum]
MRNLNRMAAAFVIVAMASGLAACGPGSSNSNDGAQNEAVSTDLGDEQIELKLWDGAGLKAKDDALIEAFEAKYPNITITATYDPDNVSAQNGPRVISASETPDIARITDVGSAARGGHVISLEEYAEAYGWDIPESQTSTYSMNDDQELGEGDRYAIPDGFTMTGIFWNKELAGELGITEAPKTIEELEEDMAIAKEAGVLPMMADAKDAGVIHLLDGLLINENGVDAIRAFTLQRDGATIDTDGTATAAQYIADWAAAGYFPDGVNAIDSSTALSRFTKGEGLFFPAGNWYTSSISEAMGDTAGFIAVPPLEEGEGSGGALDGATPWGIPTNAEHKNAAAAFINFLMSDEARQIMIENGYAPVGEGEATSDDPVMQSVLETYSEFIAGGNTATHIYNSTAGIQANALIPAVQELIDGSLQPSDFGSTIQAKYEDELGE